MDLCKKNEAIQVLEKHKGEFLQNLGTGKGFITLPPNPQAIKYG